MTLVEEIKKVLHNFDKKFKPRSNQEFYDNLLLYSEGFVARLNSNEEINVTLEPSEIETYVVGSSTYKTIDFKYYINNKNNELRPIGFSLTFNPANKRCQIEVSLIGTPKLFALGEQKQLIENEEMMAISILFTEAFIKELIKQNQLLEISKTFVIYFNDDELGMYGGGGRTLIEYMELAEKSSTFYVLTNKGNLKGRKFHNRYGYYDQRNALFFFEDETEFLRVDELKQQFLNLEKHITEWQPKDKHMMVTYGYTSDFLVNLEAEEWFLISISKGNWFKLELVFAPNKEVVWYISGDEKMSSSIDFLKMVTKEGFNKEMDELLKGLYLYELLNRKS